MTDILSVLARFFEKRGIRSSLNQKQNVLRVRIRGANGTWQFQVSRDRSAGLLVARSIFAIHIPRDRLVEVAILLAALNCEQSAVSFGINLNARTIVCRTSTTLDMSGIGRAVLEDVVLVNILATDTNLPIFMEVAGGRMTARRGIAEALVLRG